MTLNEETDLRVFVGWDSREAIAYRVCEESIKHRASQPVSIKPLIQSTLRGSCIYTREPDKKASTEFSLTRFLVPFLMEYKGWAVFCDCDFLWLEDIYKLLELADDKYAVQVVKHDYTPSSNIKMDGKTQHHYPRKNWSSMILWNCSHPAHENLTLHTVNTAEPSYLHRFSWLADEEIGSLDYTWNCLAGYYSLEHAKAIHYTDGGPWFKQYESCEGSKLWRTEHERIFNSEGSKQ